MEHLEVAGLAVRRQAVPALPADRAAGDDPAACWPASVPARAVLVHGTMDRGSSMRKVGRRLAGVVVTTYDRRGYGDSLGAGVADRIDEHVEDLLAVLDGEPAVVLGHSLGGVLALAVAARRPDLVPAVVAYEAPMPWDPSWPSDTAGTRASGLHGDDPEAAAEVFMRLMVGDRTWERLPERSRAARRAEGPALLAEMRALRRDPAPYDPAALTVPVVAARGTRSRPHHRHAAEVLARRAPHATLVDVDGANHGAHLTHPAAVAALVVDAAHRAAAATGGPGRTATAGP